MCAFRVCSFTVWFSLYIYFCQDHYLQRWLTISIQFGLAVCRGVTIHQYIDTMYDDTMHRYTTCKISISVVYKGTFILALSTFSHNVRLCITTNACILVQTDVSGLDTRTVRRHNASIKDAQDCWSNSRALCEKFSAHTHGQPRQLSANTDLSSPPLCAWMNKYRQNYIKMHILANIPVNSRLSIAYV